MAELNWYVGLTKSCQERRVAAFLSGQGVELFLPEQSVERMKNGKPVVTQKLILPRMVFFRTSDIIRRNMLKLAPGGIMYACLARDHKPIIVPDDQMQTFMAVLMNCTGDCQVEVAPPMLDVGDEVCILDGAWAGHKFRLTEVNGRKCLAICLDGVGQFLVSLPLDKVSKM